MEIKPYFRNIQEIIVSELSTAKAHVRIAVAWFTNNELFNNILQLQKQGIKVELVIINDDINHRIGCLDFQKFILNGGIFYLGDNHSPMHNKFCIIDNKVLISGSYNWTYFAEFINKENIIVFKGASDIIESYMNEFSILTHALTPIVSIQEYLHSHPPKKNLFSYTSYAAQDLYWYAKSEEKSGNNSKALNLFNLSLSIQADDEIEKERKEIHSVVNKKWQEDYIMEKVELEGSEGIFHFKTTLSYDGWLHGPNANLTWILRNTLKPEEYYDCYKITNVQLNGKCIIDELNTNTLIHFDNSESSTAKIDYKDLGYNLNNYGFPVDNAGKSVPLRRFKIQDKTEVKCSVHFKKDLSPNLKRVDFIEGRGTDTKTNHWHCFDISLEA